MNFNLQLEYLIHVGKVEQEEQSYKHLTIYFRQNLSKNFPNRLETEYFQLHVKLLNSLTLQIFHWGEENIVDGLD